MANTINPKLMNAMLDTPTWSLATKLAERAIDQSGIFRQPKPKPRPALAVPVDVQALYVPRRHSERYVKLPLELGTSEEKEATEPFETPVRRPSGVHLHWALPDGLLRGDMVEDADNPVDLPQLPNRWMVTRLVGYKNEALMKRKSWIIDAASGQIFNLEDYPNSPEESLPDQLDPASFTGLSGGSPNWTASYDASYGRFGFHDPLDSLETAKVHTKMATYVVVGWWDNSAFDPLSAVYSSFSAGRKLEAFGWSASTAPLVQSEPLTSSGKYAALAETTSDVRAVDIVSDLKTTVASAALQRGFDSYKYDRVVLPTKTQLYETVMQGVVYGVPVTGGVGKDAAPRASQIGLSLAPSLERVMAAQASVANRVTSQKEKEYLESLMTAVGNGSIMSINTKDGVVQLDELEHSEEFDGLQGPDQLIDVVVDRPESEVRGRKMRTRAAAKNSNVPKGDVIWTGRRRGKTKSDSAAVRAMLRHQSNKKSLRDVIEERQVRTIKRPGPRYHRAKPPVIGLRNFGKANRFHGDGRFTEDGSLKCQWSTEIAIGYGEVYRGDNYVPKTKSRYVPDVADRIIFHHYARDPYLLPWCMSAIAQTQPRELAGATQNRLMGEIALRYDQDGVYDGTVPIARSNNDVSTQQANLISATMHDFSIMEGLEVSPVAVTSWVQPWSPVWLEWEVELELGQGFDGWTLGRITFQGDGASDGTTHVLRGRSAITTGLAKTYQAAISEYLTAEAQRDDVGAGEIGEGHQDALADLSDFLKRADLGSVTLDVVSDLWLALPIGPDGQVPEGAIEARQELLDIELPRLIASGKLRLTRARIIDTFGRYRDIPTTKVTLPAALETKTDDGERALAMPPRLSLPSRLMWRFVDPADDGPDPADASLDQNDKSNMVNPLAGFILPDFMDESLEFFDQDGNPLGEILHDPMTGGVAWEGAVGQDGPISAAPMERLPDAARACGRIAQGMIDTDVFQRNNAATQDAESPLSAFLRAVDTTMWSVDSELASAGATIAGLVGKPIGVVSSTMWIDIPQDLTLTGLYDADEAVHIRNHLVEHAVYEKVKSRAFQVRLGELAKGHDGLYGFYINNDFSKLHLIEKQVSQTSHGPLGMSNFQRILGHNPSNVIAPNVLKAPYITDGEPLTLHAGQRVRLTLLMQPTVRVHATTGFLPRKSLELLREWVTPGLTKVAPSARVGPVLIDPDKVRLPKVAGFGASQTWIRRDTPLTWREDPILAATQAAVLPTGRVTVEEGYIRISPDDNEETS